MGRTERRRQRRKNTTSSSTSNLDFAPAIIALKKWMQTYGWKNKTRLKLANFEDTGRGLKSKDNIYPNDTLIEIPCDLLVTYATVAKSDLPDEILRSSKFKTQDLLALFLASEKRKGAASKWKCYIDTLPEDVTQLPWLLEEEEELCLELRSEVRRRRWNFESSWERVQKVVTLTEYTWSYAMVNTRAVYVDPTFVVCRLNGGVTSQTSDPPCMALCPFLDMFNHSHEATTCATLTADDNYALLTSDRYGKHQQIFISYGAHDNVTLMCEYGFFTPGNPLDAVNFTLEQILTAWDFPVNEKQYKYIRESRWRDNLNLTSMTGLSFNLKAVLYVIVVGKGDWNAVIFSENYTSRDYRLMYEVTKKLLFTRLKVNSKVDLNSCKLPNVSSYFRYRIEFLRQLLSCIEDKINSYR